MGSRDHREAVLRREREALARGPLTEEEAVTFDCQKAWEMHEHERRKYPDRFAPELSLEALR